MTEKMTAAQTAEVLKRVYAMRRDFDLSTKARADFWARECRQLVEAILALAARAIDDARKET